MHESKLFWGCFPCVFFVGFPIIYLKELTNFNCMIVLPAKPCLVVEKETDVKEILNNKDTKRVLFLFFLLF